MSGKTDLLFAQVLCRGKPTLLIELAIVRQIGLWHDTKNLSSLDNHTTVEQEIARYDRRSHDSDDVELASEIEQHHDALFRSLQQDLLAEEILTGVACD